MGNTRELALDILLSVEKGEGFDGKLIKAVLDKYDYLDRRDKAFIKRLVEGCIERQIELDYHLDRLSKTPVKKLKPLIRSLLRMGAYQILYMDSVPDSAACNEAVKLAQKRKFGSLKGYVNGVLRNLAREKMSLAYPDKENNSMEYLSVRYSMPEWIVELWTNAFGIRNTEIILAGLLREHPVSVRFHTGLSERERETYLERMGEHGVKAAQSPYLPYVYTLENVDNIRDLPGYQEGAFIVQDVSSCLCVEAAGIRENDFVMDVCAAPGGKTLLAAEKAGKVLARDISEDKLDIIRENVLRMKRDQQVEIQRFDATETDPGLIEKADVLLLDVPCSGLGVMGKKRDIKYHVSRESIDSLRDIQKRIIDHSWQYVKPGGILLYSTCTINPTENEKMASWILENFPFEPVDMTEYLPQRLKEDMKGYTRLAGEDGSFRVQLLPGYVEADGFFFAKFRRKSE